MPSCEIKKCYISIDDIILNRFSGGGIQYGRISGFVHFENSSNLSALISSIFFKDLSKSSSYINLKLHFESMPDDEGEEYLGTIDKAEMIHALDLFDNSSLFGLVPLDSEKIALNLESSPSKGLVAATDMSDVFGKDVFLCSNQTDPIGTVSKINVLGELDFPHFQNKVRNIIQVNLHENALSHFLKPNRAGSPIVDSQGRWLGACVAREENQLFLTPFFPLSNHGLNFADKACLRRFNETTLKVEMDEDIVGCDLNTDDVPTGSLLYQLGEFNLVRSSSDK